MLSLNGLKWQLINYLKSVVLMTFVPFRLQAPAWIPLPRLARHSRVHPEVCQLQLLLCLAL